MGTRTSTKRHETKTTKGVRFDEQLAREIERIAAEERRSFSNVVRILIEDGLRQRKAS